MITNSKLWTVTACLLGLLACSEKPDGAAIELQGSTMGTRFSVTLTNPPQDLNHERLQQQIFDRLATLEAMTSTYDENSEISQFNKSTSDDWQIVSPEFCRIIERARAISDRTGGAFDITVGAAVNAWGFGPDFKQDAIPGDQTIRDILSGIGPDTVVSDCARPAIRKTSVNTQLDLSAWAKGYAVDAIAAVVDSYKVADYLVEIGGEVRGLGHNAAGNCFTIGIESPSQNGLSVEHSIPLCDLSIATSGDYRNFFVVDGKTYSHTIDPRTGRPVEHTLAAVSVIDPLAANADALATALLVMGPAAGMDFATHEQIPALFVIRENQRIRYETSPALDGLSIVP